MSDYDWLGNIGGSLITGAFNSWSARQAQERQIEAQRYNSQHAHQWEVEDLRAAGLNPILSATGGSGAQSPAVATPFGTMPDLGSSMAEGVSAFSAKKQAETAEKLERKTEDKFDAEIAQLKSSAKQMQAMESYYKSLDLGQMYENAKNKPVIDWIRKHENLYLLGRGLQEGVGTASKAMSFVPEFIQGLRGLLFPKSKIGF